MHVDEEQPKESREKRYRKNEGKDGRKIKDSEMKDRGIWNNSSFVRYLPFIQPIWGHESTQKAERKAVNKYYPPDWDPSKGSINNYVGQHPLRERAKKLGQGILVIRFEMPYNIWCGGCNIHIGMGVRYNAEKSKTGEKYYSTPIYKFRMKCHLCPNYFEIVTDPKNHDYVIINGARRKEQRWDPKENEQIVPEDKRTQKKLATDAMYKLEHGSDDKQRGRSGFVSLCEIEGRREEWKDDYEINKILREKFRDEKKAMKKAESEDKDLLDKSSLDISLVAEDEQDKQIAGLIKYSVTESYDEKQKQKRKAIENRPLFEPSSSKMMKSEPVSIISRSAEIKKKLGISPHGLKKNPFDVDVTTKTSPTKGLKYGIRRKSSSASESAEESKGNTSIDNSTVISNCEEQKCDTANSSVISGVSASEEHLHSGTKTCDVKTAANCEGENLSDQSEVVSFSNQSQNALGSLMSNYSDSEEDT